MILVFGGTTEGKRVAATLEKEARPYIYSTKIEIDFQPGASGRYRYGAFDREALIGFCKAEGIRLIIHASHPFAEELHETIYGASTETGIPVLRFERNYAERVDHALVRYAASYQEAMHHLATHPVERLLALTGVQTIEKLKPYWQTHATIFRILPRASSLRIARQAGFPEENLILEFPNADVQQEIQLMQVHDICGILTKESGESGFLSTKIEAALRLQIPILIIHRPALPASFITVQDEAELIQTMLRTEAVVAAERSGRER